MPAISSLSQDIVVMTIVLVAIALVVLLIESRRRSAGWARAGRLAILLFALGAAATWEYFRVQEREFHERRARDVISLVSVDKQVDAVSMFEDIVRIRFRFQNHSRRAIDAFTAQFMLLDSSNACILKDQLSIPADLEPGEKGSWTVKYWASCPQGFSPQVWQMLSQKELEDFGVEWYVDAVYFKDGTTLQ